jgi:glycine oxidase
MSAPARGDVHDVVIIGAGVIGLAIAWRCTQRGLSVVLVDPAPGEGASHTAAGMLAPVTELHYGEQDLLTLNLESAARYPDFAAELSAASGIDIGYRRVGTVAVAWDSADLTGLRDLHGFQRGLGLESELVSGRELRQLEPLLAPGLPGGVYAPNDHQVDNRLLHKALLGVAPTIIRHRVVALEYRDDRVHGVRLDNGDIVRAHTTVLAAGAWSGQVGDLPAPLPVRPVKGQTLRLHSPIALNHVVRASVKGFPIYAVQRGDGEVVVGASSEEAGFDVRPRAGAIYELLRDVQSLIPALSEAEFREVSTSLRPGSADNAPILGPSGIDGLVYATGHYRNGILLTPITADAIAELIATGTPSPPRAPFTADRFSRVPA